MTDDAPVRVAVLGCGAIGSLYAAHLARVPGVEVWAVDPWAEHVEAIEAARPAGAPATPTSSRRSTRSTDAPDLPPCDFGIVATKAPHTRAAVEAAREALADAAVVSVQNGIGNEEVIAEVVPRVIRGTIVTAGAVTEPGVVRYDAPGDSWFGPFEPSPAIGRGDRPLAGLLTAGRPAHARAGRRPRPAVDQGRLQRGDQPARRADRAADGAAVHRPGPAGPGRRAGRRGAGGLRRGRHRAARSSPAESFDEAIETACGHKPSMLQDVLARRATEVDVLNGGIADEGRRPGCRPRGTTRWSRSCTASRAPGDPIRGSDQDDPDTGLDICRTPGRNLAETMDFSGARPSLNAHQKVTFTE